MAPGANKKKKRKAAKKKKKKQLSNKNNKGEDDSKSEEIGDVDDVSEVEKEECGSSSVGVVLESESAEETGNGGGENVGTDLTKDDDDDEGDDEGDSRTVRGLGNEGSFNHEESTFVETKESSEEDDVAVDSVEGVVHKPTGNVVSASEEVLNGNGLMGSSQVEDIIIEKSKGLGTTGSQENGDENQLSGNEFVPSQVVDTPTVETEGIKEGDYTESSRSQANVPCADAMVQRTTWKCCCGLFEVFAGSNR